jgi:thiol-disulfide isomerase/thioredoxin
MNQKIRNTLLTWAGVLAFYFGLQFFVDRNLPTGQPPAIAGATLDGKPFELSQLRGKPAVVYFWASWCGICSAMRSSIQSVAGDHPLVSVAVQSGDAAEVTKYQEENGFHPATVLDEEGSISKQYGLKGVPALFVLDPAGNIRFSSVGFTSELGVRARLWLAGR